MSAKKWIWKELQKERSIYFIRSSSSFTKPETYTIWEVHLWTLKQNYKLKLLGYFMELWKRLGLSKGPWISSFITFPVSMLLHIMQTWVLTQFSSLAWPFLLCFGRILRWITPNMISNVLRHYPFCFFFSQVIKGTTILLSARGTEQTWDYVKETI